MDDDPGRRSADGPSSDATHTELPPPVAPARGTPSGRRWAVGVTVVLVLVLTAGSLGVARDQRDVAAQWRERALALEGQRDDAVERGTLLQAQLDEVADLLVTSEDDVRRLEERILALADEKARAEDTVTTVQVERDVFAELSEQVSSVTDDLDTCIVELLGLQQASVDAFNRSVTGEAVDVEPLNEQARRTTDLCNRARTGAARASAAADQLLGP